MSQYSNLSILGSVSRCRLLSWNWYQIPFFTRKSHSIFSFKTQPQKQFPLPIPLHCRFCSQHSSMGVGIVGLFPSFNLEEPSFHILVYALTTRLEGNRKGRQTTSLSSLIQWFNFMYKKYILTEERMSISNLMV